MVFLDTSAVIALFNERDGNHELAKSAFNRTLVEGEQILTHNCVVVETASLLQSRYGLAPALEFLKRSSEFEIHWIDPDDHQAAIELLETRSRRGLSLVDCASFVVMRRNGVEQALAFDADFEAEGFQLYRA